MSLWSPSKAAPRAARLPIPSRFSEGSLEFDDPLEATKPPLSELAGDAPASVLVSLVKADLAYRFGQGERPGVAEYLDRFPELKDASDQVLSLVYEEFCLLEEYGEEPDVSQFCRRYEPWKDSLQSQLGYHRALSRLSLGPPPAPVAYPNLGDRFKGFTLREILGQGGAARVFLAEEDEVGGRKVALKVSANKGLEPSILGKLDHANIVPVHSVVVHEESGLRGLCMPYRPGMTLDRVIRRLGPGKLPSSARSLIDALTPDGHGVAPPLRDGERPGWADFPVGGTYPDAVAWIALALANALSHAHKKGILHRDVKPANVLLTFRDGPQLLDFNLAHDPNAATEAEAALRGGTLPYMAPEQLQAFLDPDQWGHVGSSADLYALGLVLRELLTGESPDTPESRLPLPRAICNMRDRRSVPATSIRSINPKVRASLASIVEKCLAFDPAGRYQSADQLAEDLRLYLGRRPLAHARNTSPRERLANVFRRNAPRIAAAAIVGSLGLGLFWAVNDRNRAVRTITTVTKQLTPSPDFKNPDLKIAESPEFRDAWESFWVEGAAGAKARFRVLQRDPNLNSNTNAWTTLLRAFIEREEGNRSMADSLFSGATEQAQAEEAFKAWTERDATDSAAWYYRARVYGNHDRYPRQALEFYKKASELNPRNKPAIQGLLRCMELVGEPYSEHVAYIDHWFRIEELQRKGDPLHRTSKQNASEFHLSRAWGHAELAEKLLKGKVELDEGSRKQAEFHLEKSELDLKGVEPYLKEKHLLDHFRYGFVQSLGRFLKAQVLFSKGNGAEADRLTSQSLRDAGPLLEQVGQPISRNTPDVKLAQLTQRIAAWRAERKMKPIEMPTLPREFMTFGKD